MTREELIELAKEVGMCGMLTDVVTTIDELERFAALVAADALELADKRIAEQAEEITMLRYRHLITCGTTHPEMYKTELDHAKERIAELESELGRERMRLVACGVVAMADTPDSAKEARKMHPDYESAACSDVARRVDECIELRSKLAVARDELLRCKRIMLHECGIGLVNEVVLAQIGGEDAR